MRRLVFGILIIFSLILTPEARAQVHYQSDKTAVELVELLEAAGENADATWARLSPAQQDLVLQLLKPNLYKQGRKIKLIAFKEAPVNYVRVPTPSAPSAIMEAGSYFLSNVKKGWTTRYTLATSTSGHAPACCQATLGLTSQYSWSHSFNANVGVTAQVVTAGIGFDVTLTGSNSYQYSLNMPPNTTWEIDAYHKHAVTDYDVWFDPWIGDSYKARSGQAFEFKGVSYSVWQVA